MADSKFSKKLIHSLFFFISIAGFRPEVSASSSNDGTQVTCNADLTQILPTPYSDLSSIVCSLIWQRRFSFSAFLDIYECPGYLVRTSTISTGHTARLFSRTILHDLTKANCDSPPRDMPSLPMEIFSTSVSSSSSPLPSRTSQFYWLSALEIPIKMAFSQSIVKVQPSTSSSPQVFPQFLLPFYAALLAGTQMSPNDLRKYHGITAVIGWGILTPAGMIIARYFRHMEPSWYYLHSSTQFMGFFIGIISISIGRNLYQRTEAAFVAHKFVGYTVCFLAALEVCQFIGRPSSESRRRQYWDFAHYWLGRTAMAMGVSNIFVGFHGSEVDRGIKISFLVAFVTLLIAAIGFEGRLRRENAHPKIIVDEPPVFRVNKP